MRLPVLVTVPVVLGALLTAAPAVAAYDGGLTDVSLADARPGAVPRPFSVRVAQTGTTPAPQEVRLAVQGLVLDPGTTTGRRIGVVDVDTTLGAFTGLAVTTAGPGDGAPGRWTLAVPGVSPVPATVRPGTDLDAAGAPVAAAGSTLVGVKVPADLPLGARLTAVTLRLNVDERRCASPFAGATNPATPGTYRVRAFVAASDGASRVSDRTVTVAADAPAGAGAPNGCPAFPAVPGGGSSATPAAGRPSLRVTAPTRRVKPGGRTTIRLRVTGGPADVRVLRGSRTLKRLRDVGTRSRSFVFRAARADAGRLVRLTFRPAGGTTRKLAIRVTRR